MDYVEISFVCNETMAEILMAELSEIGFESFIETDDGLLCYVQSEVFDKDTLDSQISRYSGVDELKYRILNIPKKNWNEEWEKNYNPIIIGDKAIVRADFHNVEKKYDYDIIITPKMSFGTGHHQTTAMMLKLQMDLDHKGKEVYDIGCGTGILSIMAAKRGAEKITGCDIDEWSVENSTENIEKNGLEGKIAIIHGTVQSLPETPVDIILANINKNIILAELEMYNARLKENGRILFSGFYERDTSDILEAAGEFGMILENEASDQNWKCLQLVKKGK
ncbi:50S ribosomal protein L11 methyltransferase [Marinigracilibium pacificum]|uniref:Ribosomal protein L11 methyltransferase n=1 Tax=Marinigracilibium pacificum TaxID=2729599 RepID=A0A848IXR8_9BACT|nr:50S ribosomal protein L11 methyltransferase [Marinigracilibium pacificum]NMM47070.1 50S ribosomal protein L11 methyltransferase [Marinigracilibium pacificum]